MAIGTTLFSFAWLRKATSGKRQATSLSPCGSTGKGHLCPGNKVPMNWWQVILRSVGGR